MSSSNKVISGVLWTVIVNIVNAIYGFIAVPLLINYFGKGEYGLIGLATSINVYMQLMDMGFNSTNIRFYSSWIAKGDNGKVTKCFQTSLSFYGIIGFLNAIILIGVSLFSASIFNVTPEQDVILKKLFYILAVSAMISWYSSCYDQLIKATENVGWIQKRTLLPKFLQILVLFLTIYAHLSIPFYFILTCFAMYSIIPWSIAKIKKETPYISFIPKIDMAILKEMLPYCMNVFTFSLASFTFLNLRTVFLGIQGTMESIADYRVLNGILGLITMTTGAFLGALLPSASKVVAKENMDAYYKVAYNGTRYVSIVTVFCCFGLMSVGPELLELYVGHSFLYLIPWMNMWIVCMLGNHIQAISSLILAGVDIRPLARNTVVSSALGLLSSWFLIPYFGVGGVIIGLAFYTLSQQLFYYLWYWPRTMKIDSKKVFVQCFAPYVIIGVVSYLMVRFIPSFDSLVLSGFVKGIAFIAIFTIIMYVALSREDIDYLKGKLLTKIRK